MYKWPWAVEKQAGRCLLLSHQTCLVSERPVRGLRDRQGLAELLLGRVELAHLVVADAKVGGGEVGQGGVVAQDCQPFAVPTHLMMAEVQAHEPPPATI